MAYISEKWGVPVPEGQAPSITERMKRTRERIDHQNPGERRDSQQRPAEGRRPPAITSDPYHAPARHNLMFGNFADAEASVRFAYPGGSTGASWSQQDATVYELEVESASLFISPYEMDEKTLRPGMPEFRRPGLERPRVSSSLSGRTGFFVGLGSRAGFGGTGGRASATLSVASFGFTIGLQHSSTPDGQSFTGVFLAVGSGNARRVSVSSVQTRTTVHAGEVLNLQLDQHIRDWILNGNGKSFMDELPDH
jgi:hypothetical protein